MHKTSMKHNNLNKTANQNKIINKNNNHQYKITKGEAQTLQ